ncbi:MAG: metal ABC transporter permease, partial [Desulfatibacillaceae bacterium]|nr:metal ABC transporter permease [Desulfatibacillaceae bacterium]
MIEALSYSFMQNALLAGLMAAVACGVMGALVVVNRIVFVSGGIAHTAYAGVGLAFFAGFAPLLGIFGVAGAAALIIALVSFKAKHRTDTVIGVLWAVGMAVGVILVDITPGYGVDLISYLFGSILTVAQGDLWMMAGGLVFLLAATLWYYHDFVALAFDPSFARVRGVPVRGLYTLLLVMVAITVVMVVQVVGLILVIALLTIGPFVAEKFSISMAQ